MLSSILEIEIEHSGEAFSPGPRLGPPSTTRSSRSYDDEATDGSRDGESEKYLHTGNLEPSAPFLDHSISSASADALPYHWLELGHLILGAASDDFEDPDGVRRLLRDLREVRSSKLRKGFRVLEGGGGVQMNGVGALEISEVRGFVGGVVDGLRKIGASREQGRREREEEDGEGGGYAGTQDYDDEEDMLQ